MRNVKMTLGLLLLASACSARLGLGSLNNSGSSSGQSGSSTADKPKLAVGGGDDEARTRELSKKLTYANVSDGTSADEIFSAVGVKSGFNPRRSMKNPEPKWILDWDALELTDETKTAIVQAAVNRTWTAKVHADYAAYRKAWKTIEDDARPKLASIMAGQGYYARAQALAELLAEVRQRAEAAKALYDASPTVGKVGLLDDIVRAMAQVHREAKVPFLLDDYAVAHQIDWQGFAEHGRPFAADDAVERDLFTLAAQKMGTFDTPPLPVLFAYGKGLKAVRWPTSDERDAETKAARASLVAESAAAKTVELPKRLSALFTGDGPDPADPKLRWLGEAADYTPITVESVASRGEGAEVELATTYEYSTPYDCKTTNQIERIDDNGGVHYVRDCKYKHNKRQHRLTVQFAELPPGLELEKGDLVTLYADLEDKRERGEKVTYRMTARALVSVKRDGKDVVRVW